METIIAPSLLAADFGNLERDCKMVNNSQADWFHIDVMDGVFVPNISFGMPVIKSIAANANKPLDVHLMIVQPERFIETFAELGSDILTVHYEASTHLHSTLQSIKDNEMKTGVALNPHTSVDLLEPVINEIDLDKALNEKLILGAALDVFVNEPINLDNPLLKNNKVLLSPHSATFTNECKSRMAICC